MKLTNYLWRIFPKVRFAFRICILIKMFEYIAIYLNILRNENVRQSVLTSCLEIRLKRLSVFIHKQKTKIFIQLLPASKANWFSRSKKFKHSSNCKFMQDTIEGLIWLLVTVVNCANFYLGYRERIHSKNSKWWERLNWV